MTSIMPVPPLPTLAVLGGQGQFPVRRIFCIGRNYADHAREMGHDPEREPPFFFSKNLDALVPGGGELRYPPRTHELHHEVEMVVALSRGGRDIPVADALDGVFGYGVGIDFTRRDLQAAAKAKGHPWDMAKSFDGAAPVSALVRRAACGHPQQGAIWLKVNGVERQRGDLAQMSWKVPDMIAELSTYLELRAGDLLFTGTPAGVGAVVPGDAIDAGVAGVGELHVTLAAP